MIRLLLFVVLSASVARAQQCLPPPSGLVGWWPGDGNANDIIGTNNGILQGGATAATPGVNGSAFHFDGTNAYVQIPDAPELNPSNLTVECWVRFDSLDTPGNTGNIGTQYMVFKQNTRTNVFEGYNLGKHRYAYDLFVWEVSSSGGASIQLDSVTAISTNVWYQVVGTRGSNFVQLYVNGQMEVQTNVTFPQDYGSLPLYFGTSGESYYDRKFSGSLDEVSLYNRALSSNEIAALYAAGSAAKCKAPTIIAQSGGQTQYWGGGATFSATVAGAPPLSYKWLKNNSPYDGATNSSLVMTNLQLTDAGSYVLVITNVVGSNTTTAAQLDVKVADVTFGLQNGPLHASTSLGITGLSGQTYGIQGATNLAGTINWLGLTNIMLGSPAQTWIDPRPVVMPQSYYRVVPGPISVP